VQEHTGCLAEEWGTLRLRDPEVGENVTVKWDDDIRYTAKVVGVTVGVDADASTVTVTYPEWEGDDVDEYPFNDPSVRWYHFTTEEWKDAFKKLKAIVQITVPTCKTKLQVFTAAVEMISSIQDASNRRRSAVDEELVEKKVLEPKK
jgi:hypothetical protein